jgi:hypothetical protein
MSTQAATPTLIARLVHRAGFAHERDFVLRVVQPALVGLIDGTVSSLAPIFAAAIAANSHTALPAIREKPTGTLAFIPVWGRKDARADGRRS